MEREMNTGERERKREIGSVITSPVYHSLNKTSHTEYEIMTASSTREMRF